MAIEKQPLSLAQLRERRGHIQADVTGLGDVPRKIQIAGHAAVAGKNLDRMIAVGIVMSATRRYTDIANDLLAQADQEIIQKETEEKQADEKALGAAKEFHAAQAGIRSKVETIKDLVARKALPLDALKAADEVLEENLSKVYSDPSLARALEMGFIDKDGNLISPKQEVRDIPIALEPEITDEQVRTAALDHQANVLRARENLAQITALTESGDLPQESVETALSALNRELSRVGDPALVEALKRGLIDPNGELISKERQSEKPQEISIKKEPREILLNEREKSVTLNGIIFILTPLNYLVLSHILLNKQGIAGMELNEFIKNKGFGSKIGQVNFELREKFGEEIITHSKARKNVPTVWSINEKYRDYTIGEQAVQSQGENDKTLSLTPDEKEVLMVLVHQLAGNVIIRFGPGQDSGLKVPSWIMDEHKKNNPNSETAVSDDKVRKNRPAIIKKVMQVVKNDTVLPNDAISYLLQWMRYGDEKNAPGDIEFTGDTQRLTLTMQGFFNLLLGNHYTAIEGGKNVYQPLSDNIAVFPIEKLAPEIVEPKISDHRLEDAVKLSIDIIRSFSKIDEKSIALDLLRRQSRIKLPEEIIKEAREKDLVKIGITKNSQKECVDIKGAVLLMVMNTIKNDPVYKDLAAADQVLIKGLIENCLSKSQTFELPKPVAGAVIQPAQPTVVFQADPKKEKGEGRANSEAQVREAMGKILDIIGIEDADTLFPTSQISKKFKINPEFLNKILTTGKIKSSSSSDKGPLFGLAAVISLLFLKDKRLKSLGGKIDIMAIAKEEIAKRVKS